MNFKIPFFSSMSTNKIVQMQWNHKNLVIDCDWTQSRIERDKGEELVQQWVICRARIISIDDKVTANEIMKVSIRLYSQWVFRNLSHRYDSDRLYNHNNTDVLACYSKEVDSAQPETDLLFFSLLNCFVMPEWELETYLRRFF
jgi:hypothetical protein